MGILGKIPKKAKMAKIAKMGYLGKRLKMANFGYMPKWLKMANFGGLPQMLKFGGRTSRLTPHTLPGQRHQSNPTGVSVYLFPHIF